MMRSLIVKSVVLSLLFAAAYVSSRVQFDIGPVQRIAETMDRSIPAVKLDGSPNTLTDADIVETEARPLFSASRRPFVAKVVDVGNSEIDTAAAAQQPVMAPRRIRLLGVNIYGTDFMALVQNQESAEVRWIKHGQTFDGWVLEAADKESAHFTCAREKTSDCKYDVELYAARHAE